MSAKCQGSWPKDSRVEEEHLTRQEYLAAIRESCMRIGKQLGGEPTLIGLGASILTVGVLIGRIREQVGGADGLPEDLNALYEKCQSCVIGLCSSYPEGEPK